MQPTPSPQYSPMYTGPTSMDCWSSRARVDIEAWDGTLTYVASYATGGLGGVAAGSAADPLASQGSLASADNGRILLAVNAGSDTVSLFRVNGDHLWLKQGACPERS